MLSLAVLVAILSGFWNLVVLFSDFDYAVWLWVVYVLLGHIVPGAAVGVLTPTRWYLAVVVAWGAILLGLAAGIAWARGGGPGSPLFMLASLGLPAVALAASWIGSRVGLSLRKRGTGARGTA